MINNYNVKFNRISYILLINIIIFLHFSNNFLLIDLKYFKIK